MDLSMALNKMEWKFIEAALANFGFHQSFINWIMQLQCVSTPTCSILLNCSPVGFFKGTRGLSQGDPVLPYLLSPWKYCLD